MGKSFRNRVGNSRSKSYHEDKNRDFAKIEDRSSHHSVRNQNRNITDELDHVQFDCLQKRTQRYRSRKNGGLSGLDDEHVQNINNFSLNGNWAFEYFDILSDIVDEHCNIGKDVFNIFKEQYANCKGKDYILASLKQYVRRNQFKSFDTYKKERQYKNDLLNEKIE